MSLDRLLIDDSIQQRWAFTFTDGVEFDFMVKVWYHVRRYLAKVQAFRIGAEEPVLRALLHPEDLYNVLRTWDREQMTLAPLRLDCREFRLNGMLLAPTREATEGRVVIELLGIRRVR